MTAASGSRRSATSRRAKSWPTTTPTCSTSGTRPGRSAAFPVTAAPQPVAGRSWRRSGESSARLADVVQRERAHRAAQRGAIARQLVDRAVDDLRLLRVAVVDVLLRR